MKIENFEAGDVVMVWASLGGQTKLRPAVVIGLEDESAQVLLGTSKVHIHGSNAVLVSSPVDMKRMGLSVPTVFEFTGRTFKWVPESALDSRAGTTDIHTQKLLGAAWMASKLERLI